MGLWQACFYRALFIVKLAVCVGLVLLLSFFPLWWLNPAVQWNLSSANKPGRNTNCTQAKCQLVSQVFFCLFVYIFPMPCGCLGRKCGHMYRSKIFQPVYLVSGMDGKWTSVCGIIIPCTLKLSRGDSTVMFMGKSCIFKFQVSSCGLDYFFTVHSYSWPCTCQLE